MVARLFRTVFRHVADALIVLHSSAASVCRVLITGVVANSTFKSVLPQAFVGFLSIEAPDALVDGRRKETYGRVTYHHIGIIPSRRAARNQSAIAVIVQHRVAESVHNLGIYHSPEYVQRPVAAPPGIEVIMVVLGLTLLIQRYLADDRVGPGIVRIASSRVAHLMPSEKGVPKVSVELHLLLFAAALDPDSRKHLLPLVDAIILSLLKINSFRFVQQIQPGIFDACERDPDLHLHRFALTGMEEDGHSGIFSAHKGSLGRNDFLFLPEDRPFDSFVNHGIKVHAYGLGTAACRSTNLITGHSMVVHKPDLGEFRRGVGKVGTGVENYLRRVAFGVCISMKTNSLRTAQLSGHPVVLKVKLMIARLCDFAFVREAGLIGVHAFISLESACSRHNGDA